MLNSAAEGKLRKSEIYWPEAGTREHGPFMITLVECQVFADYTVRTLQIVVRYHFKTGLTLELPSYVINSSVESCPYYAVSLCSG